METFGQKVRQAVESRRLPLDRVAEATGLGVEHIQALERDDFGALPGDDIVREGLRTFARLADVDPDEVIADFLRERQRWLAAVPAEVEVVGARDPRDEPKGIESPRRSGEPLVVEPSRSGPGRTGRIAILASALLALAVVALLFWSRSSTAPESGRLAVARVMAPIREAPQKTWDLAGATTDMEVSPTDTPSRTPDSMASVSPIEQPIGASELSIREQGVGKGVVHNELVGEAEQFAEGERVWFWTLVEGGTAGELIHHVWLHEGEEALRVPLNLGGARWRTRSYKDLNPGSEGTWAVEARDQAGRVLARREFLCSPRL